MSTNNNVVLYQGLYLFRNAFLDFLVEKLREAYGKGFWKGGIEPALGDRVSSLQEQYERRYRQSLASVKRPGNEVVQMLDIGHFLPIIQRNWSRCFQSTFQEQNKSKVEVWLGEIIEARNAVAHMEDQPLSDDDTWRALDNMVRLLEPIANEVASRISLLKNKGSVSSTHTPHERSLLYGWKEGPFDYELGLNKLSKDILLHTDKESEVFLKYLRHREQLVLALWDTRLSPGVVNNELEYRIQCIKGELDILAISYSNVKSFSELCIAESQTTVPEEASPLIRIRALEREISDVVKELFKLENKKAAQSRTQETIPYLERQITEIQSRLDSKRNELRDIIAVASPPSFVSVSRQIFPSNISMFVVEQIIEVVVTISNLGQSDVDVVYEEELPATFTLWEGDLQKAARIGVGEVTQMSYRCFCSRTGSYQISTKHLNYDGRNEEWDRIERTEVAIRAGTKPNLMATRYFQYHSNGIQLLTHIKNRGDAIAWEVRYDERIATNRASWKMMDGTSGGAPYASISWNGNLLGGAEQTIDCFLPSCELAQITVPDSTPVYYQMHQEGRTIEQSFYLGPALKRMEYRFPVATDPHALIVGRDREMLAIGALLEQVHQLARGARSNDVKRLLLIQGIEGTGKTRLIHALLAKADQLGFTYYVEDAKDRSPVRRMLKRVLGLRPEEDRDEIIWRSLEDVLQSENNSLRREMIFRFISTNQPPFSESDVELLQAHVVVLLKTLCRQKQTLLVFENIHLTPVGGIEEQLLSNLFNSVLLRSDEPILLCATYRPIETGEPNSVAHLPHLRLGIERMTLNSIGQPDVETLIDSIVDFPRFDASLKRFVVGWPGNPLYLIELIRLLTHPESQYLIREGSLWHLASAAKLDRVIPDNIVEIILERVSIELSESNQRLVKILSIIGFELPVKLIELICSAELDLRMENVHSQLDMLQKAGFITWSRDTGYQFEHQLKRDVIRDSLAEREQLRLRCSVSQVLLDNQIYADSTEQLRQLVRHIVKSPAEFQTKHSAVIEEAARMERDARNFDRSLELLGIALNLIPRNQFSRLPILIEMAGIHQMRGSWLVAERLLKDASEIANRKASPEEANLRTMTQLRGRIRKEQGRIMLKQPQASLETANELLYLARKAIEGNKPYIIARYFLPQDEQVFRDLIEIYLALAEMFLKQHEFKQCKQVCKRAEWLARRAYKMWPSEPILQDVYLALGDLHAEREQQNSYQDAQRWYSEALRYADSDRYLKARVLSRLADTYSFLGSLSEARDAYEQAIDIQSQLGDAHGLALSYGGLGNLFVDQSMYDDGLRCCEKAYSYQQLVSDLNRFWRTCVSLTKIFLEKGKPDIAAGYWLQARGVLFENRYIDGLGKRKREEILTLTVQFCEYFRQQHQWELLELIVNDRDYLSQYSFDKNEHLEIQLDIGVAALEQGKWREAVEAFKYLREKTDNLVQKAYACEKLGDIHAQFAPSESLGIFRLTAIQDERQDQAEIYYEEAIILLTKGGESQRALAVYDKLLRRMVSDEAGLLQLPFTYFRIFHEVSSRTLLDAVLDKTLERLLHVKLYAEAGDILTYTARIVIIGDPENRLVPIETKLTYLRQAEDIYSQGTEDEQVWGFHMLIPSFFRLGMWSEVARCFEELFQLHVRPDDPDGPDGFLQTFSAIGHLRDFFDASRIDDLTAIALSSQRQMRFTRNQQARFYLLTAQSYSYIADKLSEKPDKEKFQERALEFYNRIFRDSDDISGLASTALSDSAGILIDRKEYEEALNRYDRAIQTDNMLGKHLSAARVRVNRAGLHYTNNRYDDAFADYEHAIPLLEKSVEYWDQRLQNQDQQPLSTFDVTSLHYDKRWLAHAYSRFARLLRLKGQFSRAQALAQKAAQRYDEISMKDAAKGTEVNTQTIAASMAAISFDGDSPNIGIRVLRQCPSCNGMYETKYYRCPDCHQFVCPNCGRLTNQDDFSCPECSTELPYFCLECGCIVDAEAKVCQNCSVTFG